MTSTDSITLAHLSDLHLTPVAGFYPRHWNVKRGLGYLNWHAGGRKRRHDPGVVARLVEDMRAHSPDHVAVTGDIANIGLPGELAAAEAWLRGLGPPEQVSVIPGNHDIYVHASRDIGVERWRDYMRSDLAGRRFDVSGRDGFPFQRVVGPVVLIGLNSAVPTPPFHASGELGAAPRDGLASVLTATREAGLVRVVLIHHPPMPGQASKRRGLRDCARLAEVFAAQGCELVLHGHNHRDSLIWGEGPEGRFPIVGIASGSMGQTHRADPLARYNLLKIKSFEAKRNDGGQQHASIELVGRGLQEPGGPIVELERRLLVSD